MKRSVLLAAIVLLVAGAAHAASEPSRGPAAREMRLPPYPFREIDVAELNRTGFIAMDDAGIPRYTYGHTYDNAGTQYNPTQVAMYVMGLYLRAYLAETAQARDTALAVLVPQADWLVTNLHIRQAPEAKDGRYGVWIFHFTNRPFGADGPWVSGMTQGLGIVALTQAHAVTGEKKYLDAAEIALRAYQVPMAKGGVRTVIPEGGVYFEEVAWPTARSTQILNGFVFGLAGLKYFHDYTGNALAKSLFEEGIVGLRNRVHVYDAGWQTYYDAEKRLAQFGYNKIHAEQMMYLYELTGDAFFRALGERYELYSRDPKVVVTGDKTVPGHEPSILDKWDTTGEKYYESGPLPMTLTVRLTGCMAVYGTWIQARKKEDTLPAEMEVQISADGVNWSTPELDATMTGDSELEYSEKTLVTVFKKAVLARALRYVIRKARTADGLVKLDRLRVIAGPTVPVMATIAASAITPADAASCVCELPPHYAVKADAGEWMLDGFTPLSDFEFRAGHDVDALFYWRRKADGAMKVDVQKTRNLVVNPDLATGLTGPGHPVGFAPLAFPGTLVEADGLRIGPDLTRGLRVSTTVDTPEVAIDAVPIATAVSPKLLVAVEVLDRPGGWIAFRQAGKTELRLTSAPSANETWRWHTAVVDNPRNDEASVRFGLSWKEPTMTWFTNYVVIPLRLPSGDAASCGTRVEALPR